MALEISPSEMYAPVRNGPMMPRAGASMREWAAYRSLAPRRVEVRAPPKIVWEFPRRKLSPAVEQSAALSAPVVVRTLSEEYFIRLVTMGKIIKIVAAHYDVRCLDMVASRRNKRFVWPRHVAMYLGKEMTTRSFPEIARALGRSDLTTAMHAYKKIAAVIEADAEFRAEIEAIKSKLTGETV